MSLRAVLRAALAAIKTMAWRVIEVGGRAVLALVSVPTSGDAHPVECSEDLAAGTALSATSTAANPYELIRQLAGQIDVAPVDAIEKVGVPAARWIGAMSPVMIAKVLLATDQELADHIAGRRTIHGLLQYDAIAVADYVRATTSSRPKQSPTLNNMVGPLPAC